MVVLKNVRAGQPWVLPTALARNESIVSVLEGNNNNADANSAKFFLIFGTLKILKLWI